MACFADINVLQGDVATHARCGGIFNIHLTANYGHKSVAHFLTHPVDDLIVYFVMLHHITIEVIYLVIYLFINNVVKDDWQSLNCHNNE